MEVWFQRFLVNDNFIDIPVLAITDLALVLIHLTYYMIDPIRINVWNRGGASQESAVCEFSGQGLWRLSSASVGGSSPLYSGNDNIWFSWTLGKLEWDNGCTGIKQMLRCVVTTITCVCGLSLGTEWSVWETQSLMYSLMPPIRSFLREITALNMEIIGGERIQWLTSSLMVLPMGVLSVSRSILLCPGRRSSWSHLAVFQDLQNLFHHTPSR